MTDLVTRNQIIEAKELYEALVISGIKDSEVLDGSVAFARIFCCGGPNETANAIMVYIPVGIESKPGDVVELVSGRPGKNDDVGVLNRVTQIRQRYSEEWDNCRWDPPDERLWVRILYCEWMEEEGWVKQGGLSPGWFKALPATH